MLIAPNQTLFGVSAKLLQFAAISLGDEFNEMHFACQLGAPLADCAPVLAALMGAGWVIRTQAPARYEYAATMAWRQLRAARFGKPLSREKAETLVAAMLERVKAANREPVPNRGLITRVAVFGSFLDESKPEIGDIDLAFVYERPEQAELNQEGYGLDHYFSIEKNAAKIIKNQSQYLSLTYFDTLVSLGCSYTDLYRIEDDIDVWSERYGTAAAYPKLFQKHNGKV